MVKMSRLHLLVVGVATLLLVACSLKLDVTLFNNTSKELLVRPEDSEIALKTGGAATFYYPGEAQRWTFNLVTSQCEYVYQVPKTLEHYPWPAGSRTALKAQVEPDLSIHLLPPEANGVGVVGGYAALQQDGFPLHPISSSCKK